MSSSLDVELQVKKDKLKSIELSSSIINGIFNQITGIEHELSTVIRMQQKTLNVTIFLSLYLSSHLPLSLCHSKSKFLSLSSNLLFLTFLH